jgi:hypothetical protein
MLDEVEPLLFFQGRLEVARLADQPGFALLADAASEQWLDEDELMPIDQPLDFVFARARAQDLGGRKLDMSEQLSPIQHSGDLHCRLPAAAS